VAHDWRLDDLGDGRLRFSGALNYETAGDVLAESERRFEPYDSITVSFEEVTDADSAGLALLLEWVARAKREAREIRFEQVPAQIRAIARISEVESMLRMGERWTGPEAVPAAEGERRSLIKGPIA
jgi:phospholipid transport system transporter-binding protein